MEGQRCAGRKAGPGPGTSFRLDDQVGFILRRVTQRHAELFTAAMVESLTPPQFAVLARLRELGPCSQQRLARLVALDATTVGAVLDRLVARGFLLIADDPLDRRRRTVTLTESGQAVAEAASLAVRTISERTLEPLAPDEKATFLTLLRKIA